MDLGLEGKVAVVTGGTSGIGLATAQLLLAEGTAVAICGRDEARLQAAKSRLLGNAPDDELLVVRCDVLKKSEVAAFAEPSRNGEGAATFSSTTPGRPACRPSRTPPTRRGARNWN